MSGARGAILRAALDLFMRYGFSKTTIADIARDAEMSPANLYRFFKNKQAIGLAVVELYIQESDAGAAALLADPASTEEDRLRRLITYYVTFTVERIRATPKLVELAEMMIDASEGVARADAHLESEIQVLASIIQAGVDKGEFAVADPAIAARAVHNATKFFLAPFAIARHGIDRVEEDLAITLDLICAGLRCRD